MRFPRIFPLGDDAVTVEFGLEISPELNDMAVRLSAAVEAEPFPGLIETVPAYASTTIFYDPILVQRNCPGPRTAFESVRDHVNGSLKRLRSGGVRSVSRTVEIPFEVSTEFAPDLGFVADAAGLPEDDVLNIFTATAYRVYMLGFMPGFAYMGEVDDRIAVGRKATPRVKVPAGSVGIAGRQTGVYPLDSPGGWQIIGRTRLRMFTPENEAPCLVQPGDQVKFVVE